MKSNRIWIGICSLLLALSVSGRAGTVPLTGTIRMGSGVSFNGSIDFQLPFAGAVDTNCDGGGSCMILATIKKAAVLNGSLSTVRLTRNGDIQPRGTYYLAAVYDQNRSLIATSAFVIPAGGGSFDIGAALQTAITTQNVAYINPADLNGNNTWAGNQIFNGSVTFNSTVTGITFPCSNSAAANTVCGNNTGAPAAPSYVKVTSSMVDSSVAPTASPALTGVPTVPTAAAGTSTTQAASTAFVQNAVFTGPTSVQSFFRTALGAPVAIAASPGTTTVMSQAVTMPSIGCPCRAFVGYGVNFDTTNAGEMSVTINDGTNSWATSSTATAGAATDFVVSGAGFSTGTFASGAAVTFTMKGSTTMAGGPNAHVNSATGIGGASWMNVVIFTSN